MRPLGWPALALGVISVLLWLASYSWIVGVTPPTRWISSDASPWWVAEVAAVGVGTVSVLVGLLVAAGSASGGRRIPLWGATLGCFAAAMSLLSLAMPA